MSNKIASVAFLILACLFNFSGHAKERFSDTVIPATGEEKRISAPVVKAFKSGEKLTYSVRYLGIIPFGNVTFEVKEIIYKGGPYDLVREAYNFNLKFRPSRLVSIFRKVEWSANSCMDAHKLHSLYYEEQSLRGSRIEKRWIHYIQPHCQAVLREEEKRVDTDTGIVENHRSNVRPSVPPDVQDLISAAYFIRTQDLTKDFTFHVNERWKNYKVDIKFLGQNKVKSSNETINTHKLGLRSAPKPKAARWSRWPAIIWVSADERKIPLLVKIHTYAGSFHVKLIKKEL